MVRELGLIDIPEIAEFIARWEIDPTIKIRLMMYDPRTKILTNEDRDIYYLLIAKTDTVAVQHIYTLPEARGKKMFQFIRDIRVWVKDNTNLRFVFNYTDDIKVKRIMPYFGSEYLGDVRGQAVYRTEV